MQAFRRIDILGCPFDAISFEETMAAVEGAVRANRRLQIVPGNVDFVMKARADAGFRALLSTLDLIVPDGVPITWAGALLGTPLKRRVSGTDLVWHCAEVSARTGAPIALIGAGPGIAAGAAEKMNAAFPGARAVPIATPMKLGAQENAQLVADIRALGAKIVLVALGAPRQELWVRDHLEACGACVGVGVGSAFDIISGHKPRAPALLADNGFEWLHRMVLEPKRLGRRYLIENSPFVMHLAREVLSRRLGRSAA
jgi:N-acetylglucosaminyldiphosphoundecaprenol N-acetyl-beta-D-mannosaminyltransferase